MVEPENRAGAVNQSEFKVAEESADRDNRRKKRVDFRHNRQKPARKKNWSVPEQHDIEAQDTPGREQVRSKGDLSRKRTVMESDTGEANTAGMVEGTVVAVRGNFVDVLDDGHRVWQCTVRRILRTLQIDARSPVVVGDRVFFTTTDTDGVQVQGVIELVQPRRTIFRRADEKRTHTIAANIDQILIVGSLREPRLKAHLIDRYLVAAHAGGVPAVICLNKVDLDEEGEAEEVVARYERLGYSALVTSARTGLGIDRIRDFLKDKITLLGGQSGVGKSSILNALGPELHLPTAAVSVQSEKGRHTTTTAVWIEVQGIGVIIDTPGIRALDVAMVPIHEIEMHFVEFVDRVANCKYPNCIHIHEEGCAIQAAVEAGEIDEARYASYVQLFTERSERR